MGTQNHSCQEQGARGLMDVIFSGGSVGKEIFYLS
jgi:hypothetical protein